jgi:hypothetical protein
MSDAAMAWRLEWGDNVWHADDLTVADALSVRELLQLDGPAAWRALSPVTDPRTCAAFLAVLIARTTGDLDAAVGEVFAAPATALVASLSVPVPDGV